MLSRRLSRTCGRMRGLQVHQSTIRCLQHRRMPEWVRAVSTCSKTRCSSNFKDAKPESKTKDGDELAELRIPRTNEDAQASMAWFRKHANTIVVSSAGLALAYASSRVFMWLTTSFMSISFTDVFYAGFGTGAASLATVAGAGYLGYRQLSIPPEQVHGAALSKLRKHEDVKALLGASVVSGSLRAYALRNGQIGFDSSGSFGWLHPRVQMLFSVEGNKGSGLVSLEAQKNAGGSYEFTLLTLDTLASAKSPSKLVLVDGSEERLKVRGQLRGFLQTERVKFVEQTEADPADVVRDMDEPMARL